MKKSSTGLFGLVGGDEYDNSGVDYVRATAKPIPDEMAAIGLLRSAARRDFAEGAGEDWVGKPWRFQGYTGERCGMVGFGASAQGYLYQVSGAQASFAVKRLPVDDNISRLDVQATFVLGKARAGIASEAAARSKAESDRKGNAGWGVTLLSTFGDGDTLYLGSRESDIFCRIYDKGLQSGKEEETGKTWRFEAELSGEYANGAYAVLADCEDVSEVAYGMVRSIFRRRGLILPAMHGAMFILPAVDRARDDIDRRLAWYHNQVRPSIEKLLASGVDPWYISRALGIDWLDVKGK